MGTAALPVRRSQIKSIKDQEYAPASRTLASKVLWARATNQKDEMHTQQHNLKTATRKCVPSALLVIYGITILGIGC
jgi:hypothetical protein